MAYTTFSFDSYSFDIITQKLELKYSIDETLRFTEEFIFKVSPVSYNTAALDRACQLLFFIAGVSYYKTYAPKNISVNMGEIDEKLAQFLSKTYQRGLREFFYQNNIPITTDITFPINHIEELPLLHTATKPGMLIAVGGGKDSIVSYELAKKSSLPIKTWSLGHKNQLEPLVTIMAPDQHIWVERTIDKKLINRTLPDALNGHIPISAIFAAASSIICILTGTQDAVMSNEQSANEPTLYVDNEPVNHQYSKSAEFEQDYQSILEHLFGETIRYYSLLRPYFEAKIVQIFSENYYENYKAVVSSCNRAFTQNSNSIYWCGDCPKCAFAYLALFCFLPEEKVNTLFKGKNLLIDPNLTTTYKKLLGITEDGKPFECVGEIKESRVLMNIAKDKISLLNFGNYSIPKGFDWQNKMPNNIPRDILEKIAL